MTEPSMLGRVRGGLLGVAVGDALGAPIEFQGISEIRASHGEAGITDYVSVYGRHGAITDDTQMTLFTGEGLLRAWVRQMEKGISHIPSVVHHAYLRWLLTQGESAPSGLTVATDGWLYAVRALHKRRAPGKTCLSALAQSEGLGTLARNNSKGCGGVMRMVPVGLFAKALGDDDTIFATACDAAALTHGHPTGSLAAGYLALVISNLMQGDKLPRALELADKELRRRDGHEETMRAIDNARMLAGRGCPTPQEVELLGSGWTAEEALAIAICCALCASDFADGVLMAVNHSGDSDSTGAIAGGILGTWYGIAKIPTRWLNRLEICTAIERMALDIDAVTSGRMTSGEAWNAYPGY
jgi:ADP-ribosyl-[dinitrogen reductase] hydrolase